MKISKELIIKVMDIKYPFSDVQLNNNILSWWREDVFFEETMKINIYEFAFKCKEWAFENGYIIEIGIHPIIKQNRNDRDYFYAIKTLNGELLKKSNVDEIMKSEPTATFKACEWILNNEKNPK